MSWTVIRSRQVENVVPPDIPLLVVVASAVGAGLGLAAARLARRLSPDAADVGGAALCGACALPLASVALPAALWPAALALAMLLLSTAWLDLRARIVHLALALPLAGLGAALAWLEGSLPVALAGGALGYLLCRVVESGFRRLRGVDGLGRGDAWLLGACGVWVGPGGVGPVLALAAGGLLAVLLLRGGRLRAGLSVPFAPALAAAAWVTWIGLGGSAAWSLP